MRERKKEARKAIGRALRPPFFSSSSSTSQPLFLTNRKKRETKPNHLAPVRLRRRHGHRRPREIDPGPERDGQDPPVRRPRPRRHRHQRRRDDPAVDLRRQPGREGPGRHLARAGRGGRGRHDERGGAGRGAAAGGGEAGESFLCAFFRLFRSFLLFLFEGCVGRRA